MENNNKFLNEENYQRGKKKIMAAALVILVLGLLAGSALIAKGAIESSKVSSSSDTTSETTNKRSKEEIQAEIDALNAELVSLKAQKNQEFMANAFSEEYYRLSNEISSRESKVMNLENEIWKIDSGYNDIEDSIEKNSLSIGKSKYYSYYLFGGFIIVASCITSISIYLFAKRREILAFTTQQVIPVAKEGIDEIAPTIGNATKEIAKGISSGLKEGTKEDNK